MSEATRLRSLIRVASFLLLVYVLVFFGAKRVTSVAVVLEMVIDYAPTYKPTFNTEIALKLVQVTVFQFLVRSDWFGSGFVRLVAGVLALNLFFVALTGILAVLSLLRAWLPLSTTGALVSLLIAFWTSTVPLLVVSLLSTGIEAGGDTSSSPLRHHSWRPTPPFPDDDRKSRRESAHCENEHDRLEGEPSAGERGHPSSDGDG